MTIRSVFAYTSAGGRPQNEDSYALAGSGGTQVLVVADGLGGQGDGKAASALAAQQLAQCGADGCLPGRARLAEQFRLADQAIRARQINQWHMKTTAVYLCLCDDNAVWAHVGDTRLYHFYQGRICEYTLDHSVSQLAVALGEITHSQIPGHADRSRLLRALGTGEARPDLCGPVRLAPGEHAFLLCTDGFWEAVPEPLMEQTLAQTFSAEEWINRMRAGPEQAGRQGGDNHTAAAVWVRV